MAGAPPIGHPDRTEASDARSNLRLRILASLVLAPLALALAVWGGWPFAAFWVLAGGIVFWEWINLTTGGRAFAPAQWSARHWRWALAGAVYASAFAAATVLLRSDPLAGLAAILFLFAVVWLTDIAAYFAGRAFGGPKLMPRVSPKKTWSGAIGGTLAAIAGGVGLAAGFGYTQILPVGLVALLLSMASQAGDLAESALKRRFDVKDSSALIPGHGGLMDRLDGYAVAAVCAAGIGLARGGTAAPAQGLLVW